MFKYFYRFKSGFYKSLMSILTAVEEKLFIILRM